MCKSTSVCVRVSVSVRLRVPGTCGLVSRHSLRHLSRNSECTASTYSTVTYCAVLCGAKGATIYVLYATWCPGGWVRWRVWSTSSTLRTSPSLASRTRQLGSMTWNGKQKCKGRVTVARLCVRAPPPP